ncbi:MAG: YceH family protein [Stenotrophomonas sp.]
MSDTHNASPALPVLDTAQARVLGCLVEKQATTPDVYPLTVNAALSAANQKTAREPILALEQGVVHRALRELESLGLARQQFSSRAERYEHRLDSAFNLTRQQTALLALLLLRGPQTIGELFARSERLHKFASAEEVAHQLERLCSREPALALQLPRAPGQREDRYVHLLCGAVDASALAAASRSSAPVVIGHDNSALEQRVAALEATVVALQQQLEDLQARLG